MSVATSEVEVLVEQITREVVALLRMQQDGSVCTLALGGTCSSCMLCVDKRPELIQQFVDAGAARLGAAPGVRQVPAGMAQYIDHTLLKPDGTPEQIAKLCAEAREYRFASVCVNPCNVRQCSELLRGSSVLVCTVIGFPLGATMSEVKAYEAERTIWDGATEVDMVINIGALKGGDYALVQRDIEAVVHVAQRNRALTKVIIEAALLTDDEKVKACTLAKAAQADFVKTSTGFGPGGATLHDVELMRRTVGPEMGVKAAGGIRDYETAQKMISAGATRVGASASVKIMQEAKGSGAS
jgi:deoxyribose-phosphate aldolase